MNPISENFLAIRQQIADYCAQYSRDPSRVELVAVGKMHPISQIIALASEGQRHFGENYLQESLEKIGVCEDLPALAGQLQWHFIGHIQSRKCRDIATHFSWVHTVESLKVAQKLSQHRQGPALNICIQVNIDAEETKSGISEDALPDFATAVAALPNLALRGLMVIPRTRDKFSEQRAVFARCRGLLEQLNARGLELDQLSMGMTNDMEAAIAEGATMVRIGTALFGRRPAKDT